MENISERLPVRSVPTVQPHFYTMQTNTLTAERISGTESIMGHVRCPCNGSAH